MKCHEKLFFRLTLKCHGNFAGMARNPTEKVVGSQFVDFILKKFAEMFQRIRDIFDELQGKKNRREVGSRSKGFPPLRAAHSELNSPGQRRGRRPGESARESPSRGAPRGARQRPPHRLGSLAGRGGSAWHRGGRGKTGERRRDDDDGNAGWVIRDDAGGSARGLPP